MVTRTRLNVTLQYVPSRVLRTDKCNSGRNSDLLIPQQMVYTTPLYMQGLSETFIL